ncbi:MAG: glycosyltransferase family 4 protein [bacterium]|nr:glycosyltransferase family 4 protein [bacterium]
MKLLICTQAIDLDDPILGFFCRWVEEFSKHCESVHVICLKEGKHSLPANIRVHSLGKPSVAKAMEGEGTRFLSRIKYVWNFYKYIWTLRNEYDAVFVHMNQEYVLLGGLLWKFLGKRIFFWRNHYAGSLWTDIASALSTKVFCTSKFSYTAKFKKTVIMPVGVDTSTFKPLSGERDPAGILFLARMAPSKKAHILVDALKPLHERGTNFRASFYGSALPRDSAYYAELQEKVRVAGLSGVVRFHAGVPNTETPKIYNEHAIFVNCSSSGMYDKTIFEAAACGTLVLAASRDFATLVPLRFSYVADDVKDIAAKLEALLSLSENERKEASIELLELADKNSLATLGARLVQETG